MVGPHGIDLLNLLAERRGFVHDELKELVRCGFARQQFELLVDCATPHDDDTRSNLQEQSEQLRFHVDERRNLNLP
jgi:hypothetical protein